MEKRQGHENTYWKNVLLMNRWEREREKIYKENSFEIRSAWVQFVSKTRSENGGRGGDGALKNILSTNFLEYSHALILLQFRLVCLFLFFPLSIYSISVFFLFNNLFVYLSIVLIIYFHHWSSIYLLINPFIYSSIDQITYSFIYRFNCAFIY